MVFKERRAAPRFDLSAPVRFLLNGDDEGAGRLLNISECGLAIVTDIPANADDEIIVYPDGMGRIPGRVVRVFDGGFCVAFELSEHQRQTMRDRISAAVEGLPFWRLSDSRASVRVRHNIETHAWLENANKPVPCIIVDLSRTGCHVKCEKKPEIGVPVVIGALRGVVRRNTSDGFAVEFVKAAPDQTAVRSTIGNVTRLHSVSEAMHATVPVNSTRKRTTVHGDAGERNISPVTPPAPLSRR